MQNTTAPPREHLHALRGEMRELIRAGGDWEAFALKVFRFQCSYNLAYGEFVRLRGIEPASVTDVADIPFLPVEIFQSHWVSVLEEGASVDRIFQSSGTTGQRRSQHVVDDLDWYDEVAWTGFERCMDASVNRKILALLPGYRAESSLIHMVRSFMDKCGQSNLDSWFFMGEADQLQARLDELASEPVMVIGVTHALLAWADAMKDRNRPVHPDVEIIETGGMKGHGPERIRAEVHAALRSLTPSGRIGSEYGMTELLSQAWSQGEGRFVSPPWMQVRLGALNDPGRWVEPGRQGRIHVVDLANLSSCAFLATSDIGRQHPDNTFEVLGRFDHAEVRGCNLLTLE